jgi:hypothetical protein
MLHLDQKYPPSGKVSNHHFVKIALRIISIVVILYIGLSILGAILMMQIPRLPVNDSPASVGLAYSDVSFPTRGDHITLKGWYLPGQGDSAILIVHGGFQNRIENTPIEDFYPC